MTSTEKNLLRRINRKLAHQEERVEKSTPRERCNLGDFHLVDVRRNVLIGYNVCLEALGRELGVLL